MHNLETQKAAAAKITQRTSWLGVPAAPGEGAPGGGAAGVPPCARGPAAARQRGLNSWPDTDREGRLGTVSCSIGNPWQRPTTIEQGCGSQRPSPSDAAPMALRLSRAAERRPPRGAPLPCGRSQPPGRTRTISSVFASYICLSSPLTSPSEAMPLMDTTRSMGWTVHGLDWRLCS